jgi:hypothetical protein
MKVQDKRKLLSGLCKSLEEYLLSQVGRMPEEWDGIELREYLAEVARTRYCSSTFSTSTAPSDVRRRRDFKSAIVVNNL